jgi:hypothetical protein
MPNNKKKIGHKHQSGDYGCPSKFHGNGNYEDIEDNGEIQNCPKFSEALGHQKETCQQLCPSYKLPVESSLVEYFEKMHGRAKWSVLMGIGGKALSFDLDDTSKYEGSTDQIPGVDDE